METFSDLPAGGCLIKGEGSLREVGIWTGTTLSDEEGGVYGLLYNKTKAIVEKAYLTDSTWNPLESPFDGGQESPLVTDLVQRLGEHHASVKRMGVACRASATKLRDFQSKAQGTLANWATKNLSDAEDLDRFSTMMKEIGLDGIKQTYKVEVSLRYTITVEIEAESEEDAKSQFISDSSSYISDEIDVDYPDDTEIEGVELK